MAARLRNVGTLEEAREASNEVDAARRVIRFMLLRRKNVFATFVRSAAEVGDNGSFMLVQGETHLRLRMKQRRLYEAYENTFQQAASRHDHYLRCHVEACHEGTGDAGLFVPTLSHVQNYQLLGAEAIG